MAILILLVFTLLAFWVVLILPRQRELKRHQALMDDLKVDDDVMMTSGIYGVICAIDGDYVQLEIADGVEIKIAKRSVAARVDPAGAEDGSRGHEGESADSDDAQDIGQTPVSDSEAPSSEGDDGNGAVAGHDDVVETTTENEA